MLSQETMHIHRRAGIHDLSEIDRLISNANYYAENRNPQDSVAGTDAKLVNSESLFGWSSTDAPIIIERSAMTLVKNHHDLAASEIGASSFTLSSVFALSLSPLLPFVSENHPLASFNREIRKYGWTNFFSKTFFDDEHVPSAALNLSDTMYLSLFCYDQTINDGPADPMSCLKHYLQTAFALAEKISTICFVIPKHSCIPDFLIGNVPIFTKWSSKDEGFPFHLVLFHRKVLFAPLKIRRARVEDCDDLVPLFKQHNMLPLDAGDYHVAEILESNDPSSLSLVGEDNGKAVAFLSVSTKVAMESIQASFALDTFLDVLAKPADTLAKNLSSIASLQVSLQNITTIPESDKSDISQAPIKNMASTVHTAATNDVYTLATEIKSRNQENGQETILSDEFNAFCIKLFCIADTYMHHSFEFLKPMFSCFPHRDYCFITLPMDCPEFPLLTRFSRVPSLSNKQPSHILYMCHRYGHQTPVTLRRGMLSDIENISSLFFKDESQASKWLKILSTCDEEFEPCHAGGKSFYIIEAYQQVIGLILLSNQNIKGILDEFDVDHWIEPKLHLMEKKLNVIELFYLNPLFESHARSILKDLLVLAETSTLLYILSKPYDFLTLNLLKKEFVPLRPRRLLRTPKLKFPVLLLSANMIYEPRAAIHDRIVFVGASECSFSALQELIFHDHFYYSHLALISPEGYSSTHLMAETCNLLRTDCVGFPIHITIIKDTVAQIIRSFNRVRLLKGGVVKYDKLVLSFGRTFTTSCLPTALSHSKCHLPFDLAHLDKLLELAKAFEEGICVIGNHPFSYQAIYAMLSEGVPVHKLYHIVAGPPLHSKISELVIAAYNELNLRLIEVKSYDDIDVEYNSHYKIQGLKINEDFIPCSFLISAAEKKVNKFNFKFIHESSLVFDDGIVIDSGFSTCDPNIYAAGSATRFSSKYPVAWKHSEMNSIAIGKHLSGLFTPPRNTLETSDIPPKLYSDPIIQCSKVLNKFTFLEIRAPIPKMKLTYLTTSKEVYISIGINKHSCIQHILYFGTKKIDPHRFIALYGLHERYFHHLQNRYESGLIIDLFDYFHSPKFDVLFSDRFSGAMKDFHSYLESLKAESPEEIMKISRPVTLEEQEKAMKWFEESGEKGRIPAEESLKIYLKESGADFAL